MPSVPPWVGMQIQMLVRVGDTATARAMTRRLEADTPRKWFAESSLSWAYLALGDTTRALAALERATDLGEHWPAYNRASDPVYDPIRRSARWAALAKRVGLDAVPGVIR